MREIKFRAWEKSYKRMSKVTEIKWKEEHLYHQIFTQAIVNNKRIDDSYTYDFSGVSNGIVLMQYTGLKDKNGVEIYEGDIVTACWYDYEEPNHDMTGIVEFTEGWMSYWIADYDKKEFSELNGQGHYHWTIEVIGNIYDNPELMEGKV